jgi:hypothetical protein
MMSSRVLYHVDIACSAPKYSANLWKKLHFAGSRCVVVALFRLSRGQKLMDPGVCLRFQTPDDDCDRVLRGAGPTFPSRIVKL